MEENLHRRYQGVKFYTFLENKSQILFICFISAGKNLKQKAFRSFSKYTETVPNCSNSYWRILITKSSCCSSSHLSQRFPPSGVLIIWAPIPDPKNLFSLILRKSSRGPLTCLYRMLIRKLRSTIASELYSMLSKYCKQEWKLLGKHKENYFFKWEGAHLTNTL